MMKNILFLLSAMLCLSATAQELNVTDSKGLKQGTWRKFFEGTEQLFYKGQFKDDIAVGTFIYYYKKGEKKAEMAYSNDGKWVHNKTFYTNGQVMARGKYVEQKKDSIWNYYTDQGILNSIEHWDKGAKHGIEEVYFDDGQLSELTTHKDGLREGEWKQFYPDGRPRVEGAFVRDEFDGPIQYYFENGSKEIVGKFSSGMREGTWMYFNKDGSVRYQSVYRAGEIVKEKKENGTFNDFGPDNIILSNVTYVNGLRQGAFQEYYDDATFKLENYTDPKTGESYMREVKSGNELKREGVYLDDQLHGLVKNYNEKGILIKKENYLNGVKQ